MTKIIIAFDVEDYVHPHGADGILYSAKILRENGVVGCFNIVGRLAQALVKWGRQDVIDELKYHEIDLHSLAHSYHPSINEYTDRADYNAALKEFLKQENEAVEIIDGILGKREHIAAAPPGNSVSYVAHYGYAQMGCKVYAGDLVSDKLCCRPMHYCNLLSTDYNICLDSFLRDNTVDEMKKYFDGVAETKEVFTIYHHPAMGIVKNYWDIVNFYYGKNTPESEYKYADSFSAEEVKEFYSRFDQLVKFLKSDPRFEIITQKQLADEYYDADRTVSLSMIPELNKAIKEALFPVTLPLSLSLCDIFRACRSLLLGETEHKCGDSHGFLGEPFAINTPLEFSAEQIRKSAENIAEDGFLPQFVFVDGKKLGPADWLRAALEVLGGAETVRIKPAPWQIELWKVAGLRSLWKNIRGWVNNPNDFTDNYLSKRGELQSWTIRFPKGSQRMMD